MDDSDLERLRRDANQRSSMAKTLVGVTGLGCLVPGQDDFNEDECKKSSDQWRHDLEMRLQWLNWTFDSRIGGATDVNDDMHDCETPHDAHSTEHSH